MQFRPYKRDFLLSKLIIVVLPVSSSKESDFRIYTHTFEVGGAGKGKRQLAGVSDGWVVRDNIETGFDRFLPLWEFGLLY